MGRAEPQRCLLPALLGGLVSTGGEREALPLKHKRPRPRKRKQEASSRVQRDPEGEEDTVSPLSRVRESQDGEKQYEKGSLGWRSPAPSQKGNEIGGEGILSTAKLSHHLVRVLQIAQQRAQHLRS